MAIATVELTTLIDDWRLRTNEAINQLNDLGLHTSINITGGTINNTQIGNTVPTSGVFTSLRAISSIDLTNTTIVVQDDAISGDKIHGGIISNVIVDLPLAPTTNTQAANKLYVDTQVNNITQQLQDDIIAFSIVFGG